MKTKAFIAKYNDEWYDVPALEMLHSHLPDDPKWQLMTPVVPLTLEQFDEMPHTFHPYFQYGIRGVSHPRPHFSAGAEVDMEFSSDKPMEMQAELFQDGQSLKKNYTNVQNKGRAALVHVSFPEPGNHDLWVSAGKPGSKNKENVLVYSIRAEGGGRPLPYFGAGAYEAGLKLTSHPYSWFETGDKARLDFSTELPSKAVVELTRDGKALKKRTLVFGGGRQHRAEVSFPKAGEYDVHIFLARPGDKDVTFAATTHVIATEGGDSLPISHHARWDATSIQPTRPLHRGQLETLMVRIPKAREAWTDLNGKRVYFQAKGDWFTLQLNPDSKSELHMFAGSGQGDGTAVVTWSVER